MPAANVDEPPQAFLLPDLGHLFPEPEAPGQVETQMKQLSLDHMAKIRDLRRRDLEGRGKLPDQLGLPGTDLTIDQRHHDQSIDQLPSDLRIGQVQRQLFRRDRLKARHLMIRAEDALHGLHNLPFGIVERAVGQSHGFHRAQSPIGLFRGRYFQFHVVLHEGEPACRSLAQAATCGPTNP
jgi:hypothetical protein